MRRPVIAGNWKMYKTREDTRAFFDAFKPLVGSSHSCDIIVAPPFTSLVAGMEATRGSNITIAAQNAHWEREGAFTGEISMRMIADCGAAGRNHWALRSGGNIFGETDEIGESQAEGRGLAGQADALSYAWGKAWPSGRRI